MSDSIVMVQAFAELRYGVVVHMRENPLLDTGFGFEFVVFYVKYVSPSRDSAPKNTAHAWTDGPPPATFTVS